MKLSPSDREHLLRFRRALELAELVRGHVHGAARLSAAELQSHWQELKAFEARYGESMDEFLHGLEKAVAVADG